MGMGWGWGGEGVGVGRGWGGEGLGWAWGGWGGCGDVPASGKSVSHVTPSGWKGPVCPPRLTLTGGRSGEPGATRTDTGPDPLPIVEGFCRCRAVRVRPHESASGTSVVGSLPSLAPTPRPLSPPDEPTLGSGPNPGERASTPPLRGSAPPPFPDSTKWASRGLRQSRSPRCRDQTSMSFPVSPIYWSGSGVGEIPSRVPVPPKSTHEPSRRLRRFREHRVDHGVGGGGSNVCGQGVGLAGRHVSRRSLQDVRLEGKSPPQPRKTGRVTHIVKSPLWRGPRDPRTPVSPL